MQGPRAFQQYIDRSDPAMSPVAFCSRAVYYLAGGPPQEPNSALTYNLCISTIAKAK